jgi:hypothetical protein
VTEQTDANGCDVFVSYAHADNQRALGASTEYGWVTTLANNLRTGPGMAKKTIYIDHALKPGDAFADDLCAQVKRSSVLLLVLSQSYFDSKWCGKELDHFIRTHGDDPAKPRNVVVVELAPFERLQNIPDNILRIRKQLIHAKFWDQQPDSAASYLLGYPTPAESLEPRRYWQRVTELAQALDARLNRTPPTKSAVAPALSVERPKRPALDATVLLADVTDDLESDRQSVKLALASEGITVLPEGDYVGLSPDEFSEAFAKDIRRADLFVQMLSSASGRTMKGFSGPLPQLQFQLASQAGRAILQWCSKVPPAKTISDAGHAALFRTPFVREVHVERLKEETMARLHDILKSRLDDLPFPPDAGRLGKPVVFIDDRFGDPKLGAQIRAIVKREHCDIRSWPENLKLGEDRERARGILGVCKGGLTVFDDRRDHPIVHNRLVFFLNQVAEQQLRLSRWGVYFGPPEDKGTVVSDFGIDSEDVVGIPGTDCLNEPELLQFLRSL